MSLHGIDDLSKRTSHVEVSDQKLKIANYVWDSDTLSWVRQSQGSTGGPSSDVNVIGTVGLTNSQLRASPIEVKTTDKASRMEEVGSIIYVGYSAPGTADGAYTWAIKRIQTVGAELRTEWANGVSTSTHSWSLRAGYSYS